MRRRHLLLAWPAAALLPAAAARAQPPAFAFDHAVRLVVPFAPGGTSDILARLLAPELSRAFGQKVVVENRSGASGNLGADLVAEAPPDGHTALLIDAGILATAPSLSARLPFDPKRGLQPATMLVFAPYILAAHPRLPVRDAAGLAAFARAQPSRLNVARSGIGAANHLTALILAQHWGAEGATMVPYRGAVRRRVRRPPRPRATAVSWPPPERVSRRDAGNARRPARAARRAGDRDAHRAPPAGVHRGREPGAARRPAGRAQ